MEAIYLSILGLIITGIIGIITYAWQEHIKRITALAENKKVLYERLLSALFELFIVKSGPSQSQLISEVEKSWLFASDNVLDSLYKYMSLYDRHFKDGKDDVLEKIKKNPQVRKEFEESIAEVFMSMRKDIEGIHSKKDIKWAKSHVKIYDWGIVTELDEDSKTEITRV